MDYDVILFHPPAIYDFREKAVFPGPIAYTVGASTTQFITPPVGMLSIADYLSRNGYHARVDNLGERMLSDRNFDVAEYVGNLSAKVYGIGLNWCVHAQGAIEIARLCKKLHPEAQVVMGGLTASVFYEELVQKNEFVDAVIRGEAEKPFLQFMQALDAQTGFDSTPNLTYRDDEGHVRSTPLMEATVDLDEFEFTRIDLLEPRGSIFAPGILPSWTIPISRGCFHNCVSCGGSAYSYKTYLGRNRPAFRSPEKIAEDLIKLSEQGVQLVFLFQDPRMGGRKYWRELFKTLQQQKFHLKQLTLELFGPADEEYIRELSKIDVPIALTISPESGVDRVRREHGRNYDNDQLFETMQLCKKYGVSIGSFSMIALAEDTSETVSETWEVWEQICSMHLKDNVPADYAFGPMILLDPGSLAFDFPEENGYSLIFKNLEDYINGMSQPSWHQWVSYETRYLNKDLITKLTIDSLEFSINLRERCGFYNKDEADIARFCFVETSKEAIKVVDDAMKMSDTKKRTESLKMYQESLDDKLNFQINKKNVAKRRGE